MARKFLTGVDLANQRALNVGDPSGATDGANKQYVDNLIAGLSYKNEVRVATTTNGALATAYANGQSIDGQSLVTGDRILVKDQTTQSENGIYIVNATGAPTRASDADLSAELNNATVYVTTGTVNAGREYTQTTPNPVIGTSSIVWSQKGTGGTYTSGNGINITTNVVSAVAKGSGGLGVDAGGIYLDTTQLATIGIARKYAVNVPNGTTSATITHNLGTLDVTVAVYEISGGAEVECDVVLTSTNVVTLTFATAPSVGQYRCVVTG
jgi:hypothetical protein